MEVTVDNIEDVLKGLEFADFQNIFNKHLEWSKNNNRVAGNPEFKTDIRTINLIGVRCNLENAFNYGKNNDWLTVCFTNSDETHDLTYMQVTVDPCKYKYGMAHLRQGTWNSYKVRPHRWATRNFPRIGFQSRWAACQDLNEVKVLRTDGNGKELFEDTGFFGINIHDNGGAIDSSLGCTIVKNTDSYIDLYLPYLYDINKKEYACVNHNDITYSLINWQNLRDYLA